MNLIVRTGIDLIEVQRFETISESIRARFLTRVFTPQELTLSHGLATSLAGRFAAKEAVAKALGCGIGPIAWQEIEVLRGDSGEPLLHLHGRALALSSELGIATWSVSITHNRTQAAAVAVGVGLQTLEVT